jgi:hypothetical protein
MSKKHFTVKYIKLDKKNISYLQFIFEGYEGTVTATTINKKTAVVKLFIPRDFSSDVEEILAGLKTEMNFEALELLEACS